MTESEQTSSRISFAIPAIIAALATGGLTPFLDKSMWIDEAASLYSSHLGWNALWRQSRVVDRVYLLYYGILHIWIELSGTIEWMRVLSLLAFGLTVFAVGRLGMRLGGQWCGVLAAVLTATSPLMIDAALDARPYALATLSATVSVISLLRWIEGGSQRWIWWFSLASILALLLQLFAALIPIAVLLAVLVIKNREFRRRSDEVVIPIGLMMVATVIFIVTVIGQRGQVAWIPPLTADTFGSDLVGPASGDPRYGMIHMYSVVIAFTIALALILYLVGKVRSSNQVRKFDLLGISLVWAVSSTVGLLIISLVTPVFFDRYLTTSVPGLALFLALLLNRSVAVTQKARPRAFQAGCLGVLFAIVLVILAVNAEAVAANVFENLKGASHFLETHVGSRGEAALPNHAMTASITYYVHADHESLRTWPDVANQRYLTGPDLGDVSTASDRPEDVWLVIDASANGIKHFVTMLDRDGYEKVGSIQIDAVVNVTIEHFRDEHGK